MKFLGFLIAFTVFSFVYISCIQEEEYECVNAFDCPEGFFCVDRVCVPPESIADENSTNDSSEIKDDVKPDDTSTEADPEDSDDIDNGNGNAIEDADEVPDESVACDPGYHMEIDGDDENDDGEYSCVKNVACNPDPCNGGQCADKGLTATCKCLTGYAGRWCTDCDEGYLKSTVDEKCKPDCAHHDYGCTGAKECKVDPVKNEAGCICAEHYSGIDCTICDGAHFCNNHGMCSAPGGAPICSCSSNWTGNNCFQCADGYIFQMSISDCIKNCTTTCGNLFSNGNCQFTGTKMDCVCDPGWTSPPAIFITSITPECSVCDTANPPAGGCPE